jgi:CRISPR-associated protein Csd1
MSWMQKLYETYNNCERQIGVETEENNMPLLPICHTTQKAQIEIVIDEDGKFGRANVVQKSDDRTIIPCTEKSAGRTSGEAPHPLCDKLQYVAMDYSRFGGDKKSYFASYIAQLEEWCNSQFSHPKAVAVMKYVKTGNVIKDLIEYQILIPGKNGKLLPTWEKKKDVDVPKIFQVPSKQAEAFIRWEVEIYDDPETRVWRDQSLWNSWIDYYISTKRQKSLCYVTGESKFVSEQHPSKIQHDGDKAKLISSNDWSEFTFRGRFTDTKNNNTFQTYSVGFDVTQKAHSALRWLIGRQGYKKDGLAIVAWATSGAETPQPTDDSLAFLDESNLVSDESSPVDIRQDLAIKLKNKIAGYSQKIDADTDVVVMGLDSATPGQGRMAITYYRVLKGSDFLQRLDHWHTTCTWFHRYRAIEVVDKGTGKTKFIYPPFVGAPAPKDIAEAAYGRRVTDNLRKSTVERMLPCIVDGQPIPRDLVESTVRRASNRVGIRDPQDKYESEWNKTLSIACALYKKHKEKENYSMALEQTRTTRDYLYGRLLALADSLEEWALNEAHEGRQTNAARLMQRFAERPFSTWRTIELALTPYKARLGSKSKKRQRMIDEVMALFNPDDFTNDKPLSGEFLLGYHSQREFLRPSDSQQQDETQENTKE